MRITSEIAVINEAFIARVYEIVNGAATTDHEINLALLALAMEIRALQDTILWNNEGLRAAFEARRDTLDHEYSLGGAWEAFLEALPSSLVILNEENAR